MILGSVNVDGDAVVTHRDSYLVASLSVVSVRRPFLGPALLFATGFSGFGFAFRDLLYPQEIAALTAAIVVVLLVGWRVGQLKLLSRDLRGSELSDAIWGTYGHLNQVRAEIVACLRAMRLEDRR